MSFQSLLLLLEVHYFKENVYYEHSSLYAIESNKETSPNLNLGLDKRCLPHRRILVVSIYLREHEKKNLNRPSLRTGAPGGADLRKKTE
jgi:hypothetical protein